MTPRQIHGFKVFHVMFKQKAEGDWTGNFLLTYEGKRAPFQDFLTQEVKHTGTLFLDSGAFPAMRKNTDLDVDKYIEFVNTHSGVYEIVAQLDYMPRMHEINQEGMQMKSADLTWERMVYMLDKVDEWEKLAYVVHPSEPAEMLLRRALKYVSPLGRTIKVMGIGLARPDKQQRMHLISIWDKVAREANYQGKFHAFGLQDADCLGMSEYITSCDSSSAIRDQMNGVIFIQGQTYKLSDDTEAHHKSDISPAHREEQEKFLRARAEEMGVDYEAAKTQPQARYLWCVKERDLYFTASARIKPQRQSRKLI